MSDCVVVPPDFRRRFLALLSYQFSTFSPPLALNIIQNRNIGKPAQPGERGGMARRLVVTRWGGSRRQMLWSRRRDGLGIERQVLGTHLPLTASCSVGLALSWARCDTQYLLSS